MKRALLGRLTDFIYPWRGAVRDKCIYCGVLVFEPSGSLHPSNKPQSIRVLISGLCWYPGTDDIFKVVFVGR